MISDAEAVFSTFRISYRDFPPRPSSDSESESDPEAGRASCSIAAARAMRTRRPGGDRDARVEL